jgi:hypothetical protein
VAGDDLPLFPRSGPLPQPAHAPSPVDRLAAEVLEPFGPLPQARLSVAVGGRPACCGNTNCALCPVDARASMLHLLDDERLLEHPRLELRAGVVQRGDHAPPVVGIVEGQAYADARRRTDGQDDGDSDERGGPVFRFHGGPGSLEAGRDEAPGVGPPGARTRGSFGVVEVRRGHGYSPSVRAGLLSPLKSLTAPLSSDTARAAEATLRSNVMRMLLSAASTKNRAGTRSPLAVTAL